MRLYHDAMVAEVCSSQQIFRFKARYDYPNKKLHQRDEKHQIKQTGIAIAPCAKQYLSQSAKNWLI